MYVYHTRSRGMAPAGMQAELDSKAEKLAALEQIHERGQAQAGELGALRTKLEQQLAQADEHIKHLEQQLEHAVQREDVTKQNLVAAQQDYERLRVRAVHTRLWQWHILVLILPPCAGGDRSSVRGFGGYGKGESGCHQPARGRGA
jgi:septal ring factor EnvC (AmiA/AmiB activator)